DQRIKIQFTEQQKEYLRQRTHEQRFSSINEHIRYKLVIEQDMKEFITAVFQKQQEILTKILEQVTKRE
ncbi:MAG: hypothetical protein AABX82_05815, partial [Nanoarchaeota archaeon]